MTNLDFLNRLKKQAIDLNEFKAKFMLFNNNLVEFEKYINSQSMSQNQVVQIEKENIKKLELKNDNQNAA